MAAQAPSVARVGGALTAAVLAVSSAAVFILLAEPVPPLLIAAGRVAVTGIALCVLAIRAMPVFTAALRSDRGLVLRCAGASALLALHFGAWIASLSMTTVLRSVALVATQPIFAGLLGLAIGDRAPRRLYLAAAIAVAGTVVMMDPTGLELGQGDLAGDLLALVGAAAAAGYLVIGRSVRARVPLRAYLGAIHLGAALALLATAAVFGLPLWPSKLAASGVTATDLLALLYLGLVPGVVGHGLLNWAVRQVPVHVVALAILLEPIGATALAAAVLGRPVGGLEAIGAAILLCGVALGVPRREADRR